MPPAPRVVYAKISTSDKTRIHTPGRTVPIIVVPDMLGTRLTDPDAGDPGTGELVWNPKGAPFGDDPQAFVVNVERLQQMSAELVPDDTHPHLQLSRNEAQPKVKHWRAMVGDIYGPLTNFLLNVPFEENQALKVKRAVYFCGYDWRQDNALSALRLARMVDDALAETGERKVVLVGHGMGGAICRYYCRALGGESRVHQTFLVGDAVLGAPTAFAVLKHGLEGIYPREIQDAAASGQTGGLVFECAAQGANALASVASMASSVSGGLASLFGNLYLLLCVSTGRWLSRRETRSFARQMPSLYQMLPGALYCKKRLHWAVFDPMATGVAPTGFMVPLPTVFDSHMGLTAAALDRMSGSAALGTQLQAAVQDFVDGPSEGSPSSRSSRNAMPFVQMMARIGTLQATAGPILPQIDWFAGDIPGQFERLGLPDLEHEIMQLIAAFKALKSQAERTFIDCRNPRRLYDDIYTGLLDAVDERPLCAANLALAYRFDEALTVNARPAPAVTLAEVLLAPLSAMAGFLLAVHQSGAGALRAMGRGFDAAFIDNERQNERDASDLEQQTERERRLRERHAPKAYLPPRTYAIFSDSELTSSGCLIQPLAFVSNDDSNVVRSAYLPNLLGDMGEAGLGDGTVPAESAHPDDRLLRRPFAGVHAISGHSHAALTVEGEPYIRGKIAEGLPEFCKS